MCVCVCHSVPLFYSHSTNLLVYRDTLYISIWLNYVRGDGLAALRSKHRGGRSGAKLP